MFSRSFFLNEGPSHHSLKDFVQPCDEDEQFFLPIFTTNGTPVE
jgi:hypothetical protein